MAASTNPKTTSDTSTFTLFEADTPWGSAASLDGLPLRKAIIQTGGGAASTAGPDYTFVVSTRKSPEDTIKTETITVMADINGGINSVVVIGQVENGYIVKVTGTASAATAGRMGMVEVQTA
jgi:hypothetical protein